MELTKEDLEQLIKGVTEPIVEGMANRMSETTKALSESFDKKLGEATATLEDKVKGLGVAVTHEPEPSILNKDFFATVAKAGKGDATARIELAEALEKALKIDKTLADAANTVYDADGGFLVRQDVSANIMQKVYETGQLVADMDRLTVGPNSNGMTFVEVVEDDRSTEGSVGGVRAYWKAQAESATSSKPKFREHNLKLEKAIVYVKVTDEQLADSTFLNGFLGANAPRALMKLLDKSAMSGTGAGEMLGILNSSALVTVAKEASQTADTIKYENVVKMRNYMPAEYMRGAKWYINQEGLSQLDTMVVGSGSAAVPAYNPSGNAIDGAFHGTLLGYPVVVTNACKKLGDLGDIVFANMGEYMMLEKGGIEAAVSMHVHFDTAETAFRYTHRTNGTPKWVNSVTPENANTGFKISPFVALAARA